MTFIEDWESRVSSVRLTGVVRIAHSGGRDARSIPLLIDVIYMRILTSLFALAPLARQFHAAQSLGRKCTPRPINRNEQS